MSKKNKSLSLLMATATVASVGVGSAVTSFGAYTESQANSEVQSLTNLANVVSDFVRAVEIDYNTLLSWIETNGSVNVPNEYKGKAKAWLDSMQSAEKLSYKKEGANNYSFKVGKDNYDMTKIKELLATGKAWTEVVNNSSSGSDGFVVTSGGGSSSTGSSSTGSSSTGSSSTSSSSTGSSSTATKSDTIVETKSTVAVQYKLDEIKTSTQVNLGQMVQSLKDKKEETAVTLDVGNAKWIIEKKGLDETKAANFSFNPAVATTEVSHTTAVIPENVKKATEGKANVVINFTEKQVKGADGKIKNQELPFNAKVAVTVGAQYANKKMKVYYIVNGKSYEAGTVVVDKNGRVLCGFHVIGDFVLVEEGKTTSTTPATTPLDKQSPAGLQTPVALQTQQAR